CRLSSLRAGKRAGGVFRLQPLGERGADVARAVAFLPDDLLVDPPQLRQGVEVVINGRVAEVVAGHGRAHPRDGIVPGHRSDLLPGEPVFPPDQLDRSIPGPILARLLGASFQAATVSATEGGEVELVAGTLLQRERDALATLENADVGCLPGHYLFLPWM